MPGILFQPVHTYKYTRNYMYTSVHTYIRTRPQVLSTKLV